MVTNGLLKAMLLIALGAASATVGFVLSRNNVTHEVSIAADQVQLLLQRLDRIEIKMTTSQLLSSTVTQPAAASPEPVRLRDRTDEIVAVLESIRSSIETLTYGQSRVSTPDSAGISKKLDALATTLALDESSPRRLRQRLFCWTPAQVYATYGMPDSRGGGLGAPVWYYEIPGGLLHVQFLDGIVCEAYVEKTNK